MAIREGPFRRRLKEWRERKPEAKGQTFSPKVDVSRVLDLLVDAESEVRAARVKVSAEDYKGAHRHIQTAHEWLRHATRAMGFKPEET